MNQNAENEDLSEPGLSGLIAEDNPTWNCAFPKLYGRASDVVPGIIKGADDHVVNEIFKRSLEKLRIGLTIKRSSPDPQVGQPWKELRDFSDVRNMFANIVRKKAIDYVRKHRRECQYEDQLMSVPDETDMASSLEWNATFHKALSRVTARHRNLLIGRYIEKLETVELMTIHNLSEEALNTAISRAKAELRAVILDDPEFCLILWPKKSKG